ncbi:hypothetical protein BJ878DRAFT_485726 [Calycina marina]|uniref:Uncharacterized protein n=1 Tax=Calycina marina TaxID=1763456 RepID=A0A9P8CKW4_9HELO|nr:hypothetical protein BJ878DRAFT_485726 [Calycina marina]
MSGQQSKADLIDERRSNLPLPEDPPTTSDWNSADSRKTGTGSGSISTTEGETLGINNPTKGSGVREAGGEDLSGVGRQGREGLSGLPKDATS